MSTDILKSNIAGKKITKIIEYDKIIHHTASPSAFPNIHNKCWINFLKDSVTYGTIPSFATDGFKKMARAQENVEDIGDETI